jgi:uncharacterized membrane protein
MRKISSKSFWQALSLGVLAGMRTTSAPVIANQILIKHPSKNLSKSPLKFIGSKKAGTAFKVSAVGELVGDKLPFTPNRIEPGGIIGRCLSGGLVGAAIFKTNKDNAFIGALIGSAAAFAGTFGSYYLRREIVKRTDIYDPLIGALEDALVIGAGIALVKSA